MFRQDRKISQSKLELEAGLSFGTISRIENGIINPTKETLLRISSCLKLNDSEFSYLIKIKNTYPSEEEINSARTEIRKRLAKSEFPAYLMDCGFRIWQWNDQVLRLFNITEEQAQNHLGQTYIQILFSSDFNIIENIPKNKLFKVIRQQVWGYRKLVSKHRHESLTMEKIQELKKDGFFRSVWEEFELYDREMAFGDDFYYSYKGKSLSMLITTNELQSDNRFILVRYYPKDLKTAQVFQNLKKNNAELK